MYHKTILRAICIFMSIVPMGQLLSTTIYTPEGQGVTTYTGTPEWPEGDSWTQGYINAHGLDAEIIVTSTPLYNCHGYAWAMTEGLGSHWLQSDEELKFTGDGAYANDDLASYISCSAAEATHILYPNSVDHSIRVIRNGYPVSTNGTKTQVSKWGAGPTVRHALRNDYYAHEYYHYYSSSVPIQYFKLKTTHSGTLSNYPKTWVGAGGQTHTLTGNVTVPSGVTLTLMDGVEVYSNSKSLTINNGGTLVINSDLEVPTGTTITFSSGSKLDLNGYTLLANGGAITNSGVIGVDGTKIVFLDGSSTNEGFYQSVQSAINTASSGQDIYVGIGFYDGNDITMKNGVDIIGSGYSGGSSEYWTQLSFSVTFDDDITSNTKLQNLRVNEDILFDNASSAATLQSVWVGAHSGPEIEISNADPTLLNVHIWQGGTGIYAHSGYNWPYMEGGEIEQFDNGILATDKGYFEIEELYFCEQDDYDIKNTYTGPYVGQVYCYDCIWSDDPEDMTYGNVGWYPAPPYGYPETCGMYRAIPTSLAEPSYLVPSDTIWDSVAEALDRYRVIRRNHAAKIAEGIDPNPLDYATDMMDVIDRFRVVAAKSPDHPSAALALGGVVAGLRLLKNETAAATYIQNVLETTPSVNLKPYAQSLMVSHYRRAGDFKAALSLADTILAGTVDDYLAGETLYTKGLIYERDLGNEALAADMYKSMVLQYPDHPTITIAGQRLEKMGEAIPMPDEPVLADPIVEELSLSGYPNPFNPTATISFGLPETGKVTLVVYDLMGREVVRLLEGYRDAGWQAVVWDGRNARGQEVPTGIYIARLVTPQGIKAIKLVMMK